MPFASAAVVFVILGLSVPVPRSAPPGPATIAPATAPAGPLPTYAGAIAAAGELPAESAAPLLDFVTRVPADPDAPDALWDAARLALDRLQDPALALHALDRLLAEYPESRPAKRARQQRAELEARGARSHPEALAVFLRLPDDAAALRAFLAQYPDFPEANTVRLRLVRLEPEISAGEATAEALMADPAVGWRAGRALADERYRAGDYAGAVAAAERVDDPAGASRARRMLRAQRLGQACLAWVGLTALFLAARTSRAGRWRPVPGAVKYYLPVALVFLAMAYPMDPAFRPAMLTLVFGGAALLWVLSASPRRFPVLVRVGTHALTMAAFVYAVIFHFGVLAPLVETLKNGLQR